MHPRFAKLSDHALIKKVHQLEAYGREDDPDIQRFRSHRTVLSRKAWQSLTDTLECDRGSLAKTGVETFPLDPHLADRLLRALHNAPRIRMIRPDFSVGYVNTAGSQCDYLNTCNQYHALTPASRALLAEFLSAAGPIVEEAISHPFRIASTRQFQLVPNRSLADPHLDGWPVAMRKIFVLPQGCGKQSSTTWFRRRDGTEFTLESERPIWVIFENSVVLHAPISGVALRPTIEFDIVPAWQTSFELVYAGLAGWYPTFPTDEELREGTRGALRRHLDECSLPPKSWASQFIERAAEARRRLR